MRMKGQSYFLMMRRYLYIQEGHYILIAKERYINVITAFYAHMRIS